MAKKPVPKHASKAGTKRATQYKAKGHLKQDLEQRKKRKALQKKIDARELRKGRNSKAKGKKPSHQQQQDGGDSEDDGEDGEDVDALLQGELMSDGEAEAAEAEEAEDDEAEADEDGEQSDDDLNSDLSDLGVFLFTLLNLNHADLALPDDATTHKMDLQLLKEKDPEFYNFLAQNDAELLDFNDQMAIDEEDDSKPSGPTVLTHAHLSQWSKTLVQTHSLKVLRRLLLAFRSAAEGSDEDQDQEDEEQGNERFAVQSADVFQALVTTTLKFTPVVLSHHLPAKKMPNGKLLVPPPSPFPPSKKQNAMAHLSIVFYSKLQTQHKKYALVQRYIKNFFFSLSKLLESTPASTDDSEALLSVTLSESAKLIPYVVGNRRVAKTYLNVRSNSSPSLC